MGGGYSVETYSQPLVCPSDCDAQTWQQILMLYDRLDSNGDHAIENSELQAISKLHINNEIKRMEIKMEEAKNSHEQKLRFIRASNAQEMHRLREKLAQKVKRTNDEYNERKVKFDDHIKYLKNMEAIDRARKFKQAVSGQKKTIEFWDFYNYMRYRVDDIPNIVW